MGSICSSNKDSNQEELLVHTNNPSTCFVARKDQRAKESFVAPVCCLCTLNASDMEELSRIVNNDSIFKNVPMHKVIWKQESIPTGSRAAIVLVNGNEETIFISDYRSMGKKNPYQDMLVQLWKKTGRNMSKDYSAT